MESIGRYFISINKYYENITKRFTNNEKSGMIGANRENYSVLWRNLL
jgi:hypothetical protein